MNNSYYKIFDNEYIAVLVKHVRLVAHESVRGRRNQLEAVPAILKATLYALKKSFAYVGKVLKGV